MLNNQLAVVFVALCFVMVSVDGHGYIIDPPGRSSLWRVGIKGAPCNNDDNGINCGGFSVIIQFGLSVCNFLYLFLYLFS